MKKILVLFLAALLVLSCLPALAEGEETVITVATWQNSILMEEMLERFNATHPGIKAVTAPFSIIAISGLLELHCMGTLADGEISAVSNRVSPVFSCASEGLSCRE